MIKTFMQSEDGMGAVEIILIIIVLISIVAIFRNQITSLVNTIWKNINRDAKDIYN